MTNQWIEYVKSYAKDHNLKYNEALKQAGKSYKEIKGNFNKTNKIINGNGLKSITFQKLLEASYSGKEEVEGFIMDKSISSKTSKSIFIHRGKLSSLIKEPPRLWIGEITQYML